MAAMASVIKMMPAQRLIPMQGKVREGRANDINILIALYWPLNKLDQ